MTMQSAQSSAVTLQQPRKFLLYSPTHVALCQSDQDLYWALQDGIRPHSTVLADESLELLNFIAQQHHPSVFYQNYSAPHTPLSLPAAPQPYALHLSPIIEANSPVLAESYTSFPVVATPFWGAISGLNGFYVASNLNEFVGAMADPSFLTAPRGEFCCTETDAYTLAKNMYISRFFRHYDSRFEAIALPANYTQCYLDPNFTAREERWAANNSHERFNAVNRLCF